MRQLTRIDIIRTLLAGRNEKILELLFGPDFATVTDQNGTIGDLETLETRIGVLSSGEKIMCRVAMDIWGDYGKAQIGDICHRLDGENFVKVIEAMAELRSI